MSCAILCVLAKVVSLLPLYIYLSGLFSISKVATKIPVYPSYGRQSIVAYGI